MAGIVEIIAIAESAGTALLTAGKLVEQLKKIVSSPKPDISATKEIVLDLFNKLLDAKRDQIAVEQQLADLKRTLDQRDDFAAQASRYALAPTEMAGFVYALKPECQREGEPAHAICATCHGRQKITILQPLPDDTCTLVCPECGTRVPKTSWMAHLPAVGGRHDEGLL